MYEQNPQESVGYTIVATFFPLDRAALEKHLYAYIHIAS